MYPKNAASPPRIAVGPVVQISDGAVQASGVSIKVRPEGGSASAGGGTTAYEEGIVLYTPTQAETDYTAFVVIAYKTDCIPTSATVVTTATAVAGKVDVGAISGDATAADNLESACDNYSATRGLAGTALPAAAADAAGGLVISDAGGLDIDAKLANTHHLPNAAAGAAGGVVIAGSNAATTFATLTVTGDTTLTGNLACQAGITVTQSTVNGAGVSITGNGSGTGFRVYSGATGQAAYFSGATYGCVMTSSGSGNGLRITGAGANSAVYIAGGSTGHGIQSLGGVTSGDGIYAAGQTLGDGMTLVGAGEAQYDLNADIQGNIIGNLVGTVSTVTTLTGHTAQTGDTYALAAGATGFAAIDTVVDAILVDTAVIGALGAGLTAVPWNAAWDAEVESECNDALVALHLDHLLAVDYDPASKPGTATALLNELVESDSGVSRFTVNALENAPSGTGASAETIADAVWDEVLDTAHEVAGSASVLLQAAGGAADPLLNAVPGAYGAGTAGYVLGTYLNAPVGTVDTVVDGLATELAKVPKSDSTVSWNATALAAIQSECNDALVAYDPPTNAEMEARTLVAANYATAANQTTILGYVDCLPAAWVTVSTTAEIKTAIEAAGGHLALILEDTGTTLPGTLTTIAAYLDTEIAAILADTNELQTDWVNGGRLDLLVDAILEDTGTTLDGRIPAALVTGRMSSDAVALSGSTTAADKLELSALSIETGAAAAGTLSTTQMTTTLTEATNDHYIGRIIIWTSGVLIRQASDITDYVGSGGLLTFTAVTEAPTAGDTFIIV